MLSGVNEGNFYEMSETAIPACTMEQSSKNVNIVFHYIKYHDLHLK